MRGWKGWGGGAPTAASGARLAKPERSLVESGEVGEGAGFPGDERHHASAGVLDFQSQVQRLPGVDRGRGSDEREMIALRCEGPRGNGRGGGRGSHERERGRAGTTQGRRVCARVRAYRRGLHHQVCARVHFLARGHQGVKSAKRPVIASLPRREPRSSPLRPGFAPGAGNRMPIIGERRVDDLELNLLASGQKQVVRSDRPARGRAQRVSRTSTAGLRACSWLLRPPPGPSSRAMAGIGPAGISGWRDHRIPRHRARPPRSPCGPDPPRRAGNGARSAAPPLPG